MTKKYELTNETKKIFGITLYRIRALKDFSDVKKGELGGFVQSEKNLSHDGNCWVYNNAVVRDNGLVKDNGIIRGYSLVCDHGKVLDNGKVLMYGTVSTNGMVCDNGEVYNQGKVWEDAIVKGNGKVYGTGLVRGNAVIQGNGTIKDNVVIAGNAIVKDTDDYVCFLNSWSDDDDDYFTWTKSNNMWYSRGFHGTKEEFLREVYEEYGEKSGKMYEKYVKFVEDSLVEKS